MAGTVSQARPRRNSVLDCPGDAVFASVPVRIGVVGGREQQPVPLPVRITSAAVAANFSMKRMGRAERDTILEQADGRTLLVTGIIRQLLQRREQRVIGQAVMPGGVLLAAKRPFQGPMARRPLRPP